MKELYTIPQRLQELNPVMAYAEDRTVGLIDNDLSVGYILPSAVLGFLILLTWRWMRKPKIPTINSYFGDITLRKAHSEFMSNARGLVKEGVAKVRFIDFLNERNIVSDLHTFSSTAHFALSPLWALE